MNLTNLQGKLGLVARAGLLITLTLFSKDNRAQPLPAPSKNIGDPAPALYIQKWLKGTPVSSFKKGNIYIIELWATWCRPCRAAMPHLSELARKYRDTVNFIGIDILEAKPVRSERIKAFVDSMGQQMDYTVALDDNDYILQNWLRATGEGGIPSTFIIDREGRLAWIGHPCEHFEEILSDVVNNTWDVKKALDQRNLIFRLKNLEDSVYDALEFAPDGKYRNDNWNRDSALLLVEQVAMTEPLIKYTPRISARLLSIFLKNDLKKAYKVGKEALANPTYESSAYLIMGAIEILPREINLTPEIYQLGIEALQELINGYLSCYPELYKLYKYYYRMAEWYWIIGNKSKAIEAQEKAVENLKAQRVIEDYQPVDLAIYETWLRYYKNM